ncbi:MAG: OsmC family peroxiredoxin [Bacteroidales bacterium]|nr:OsmC family peroxiredoxin [Bacteroidales bacterium]
MKKSNASAVWNGTLKEGKGNMSFTGYKGPYTFASRFEEGKETNPEELLGAAQAGCYSMFLSALISGEGLKPESIDTNATVSLGNDDTGPKVEYILLSTKVKCEGLSKEKFNELAQAAKEKCPVSRLYEGGTATVELEAELL